jgi:hypothetical protein
MEYLLKIKLDRPPDKTDLTLRNIFADTIEDRQVGEIVELTSSDQELEVIIESENEGSLAAEIANFMSLFGIKNYSFERCDIDNLNE